MSFWDIFKTKTKLKEQAAPAEVAKATGFIPKPKSLNEASKLNQTFKKHDLTRWSNDKSVIGYKIVRSNNCNPDCEICKVGAGEYPKDFHWSGWHDKCKCFISPITMSDEDFEELLDLEFDDKPTKRFLASKQIKKIPASLKTHIRKHRKDLEASNPEWFTSNDKYLK